ncbi:hypothetical protein GCM10023166_19680 [Paeniglutamicibacter cryotolerans]|uniref:Uncharacterized protein n=1 Tax=Paeniglutamicibacter cryotolerans TaxID=670079 RepID=A0A839QFL4_9MICC|nr:hypothetical protein [Paeniglutamicibacter cryotolerans]
MNEADEWFMSAASTPPCRGSQWSQNSQVPFNVFCHAEESREETQAPRRGTYLAAMEVAIPGQPAWDRYFL